MTDLTCGTTCGQATGTDNYYDENYVCIECVQSDCATCDDASACTLCN